MLFTVIFILFLQRGCYGNVVLDKTAELYSALLINYNEAIHPFSNTGGPLVINVTLSMTSLNELDEVQGEMNTVGYLNVKWMDERLRWNPATYAGITHVIYPASRIWKPPLVLANPSFKLSSFNGDITQIRVYFNGLVYWNPADVLRTKCRADIRSYPFDQQACEIGIIPWGFTADEIRLNTPIATVPTPFYIDNGEWLLIGSKAESFSEYNISIAKFTVTFNRRPQFFVINVVLPIICLSALNVLVFLIPVESGERISYSITVLLSFAVFMTLVGDNIPKTSDPMSLLSYYLISVFSGSATITTATIINIKLFYNHPDKPIPAKLMALAKYLTRSRCRKAEVRPCNTKENAKQPIAVIDLENDVMADSHMERSSKEKEENESHPNGEKITWKDVARALDTFLLYGSICFFVTITVSQLVLISASR